MIFPCAFPMGLPRSIREGLLTHYRGELVDRLLALLKTDRRESSTSVQSKALSSDRKRQNTAKAKNWLMRQYQNNWESLDLEERTTRWERARKELPVEMFEGWWLSMGAEQRVGLVPPGGGGDQS